MVRPLPTDITREEYELYAYQNLIRRVLEAADSIRTCDSFDLTESPESITRWKELCGVEFNELFNLVDFCMSSGNAIIKGMEKVHDRSPA